MEKTGGDEMRVRREIPRSPRRGRPRRKVIDLVPGVKFTALARKVHGVEPATVRGSASPAMASSSNRSNP